MSSEPRKPLSRREALAYYCPECLAIPNTPCVARDGHAIKHVHVRRQFPFGLFADAAFPEAREP